MSISSVGPAGFSSAGYIARPSTKLAPDGDTAAVEARESNATQKAEKLNGGFAPKSNPALAAGGLNTVA